MERRTLIEKLTPTINRIRALHGHMGTRPYRVWRVRTKWTGTRRGEGQEVVIEDAEITPTPRVGSMSSLKATLHAIGRSQGEGAVELSEISLDMREEEVSFAASWTPVGITEQWYYEVRYSDGVRRRFTVDGVPERDTRGMGWRVMLKAQDAERTKSGRPAR